MIIKKLLTEFFGTFIFLGVILTTGQAFPIGLALATSIYFGGSISGGHFNPAVTIMMLFGKKINIQDAVFYIIAQVIGGLCVLGFVKHLK
jgi:aquaporin Z